MESGKFLTVHIYKDRFDWLGKERATTAQKNGDMSPTVVLDTGNNYLVVEDDDRPVKAFVLSYYWGVAAAM